ncbi:MAG: glycosyltransferase [Planctomycetota bacterium]
MSNRLARHISFASLNPGIKKSHLEDNYDLFLANCFLPIDLLSLNALEGWKQRCRTTVCWLSEIWAGELPKWKGHLKILSQFDYVILSCSASVGPVQDAIQKPCLYVPYGVDTIRFCPYPDPPVRSIDMYSIGRRSNVTHQALLKMAEQKNFFYIYDTINKLDTSNPSQHRSLVASIARRSRYFFANAGKIDLPSETQKQAEIGPRFFEGAAAGTIMLGEHPVNDAFKNNFDWPDAVIDVPFNSPNIAEILVELDSQAERLEEIRRNNIVQSLLRHDWAYRWRQILDMVGLEPKPALIGRQQALEKLAHQVSQSSYSGPDDTSRK